MITLASRSIKRAKNQIKYGDFRPAGVASRVYDPATWISSLVTKNDEPPMLWAWESYGISHLGRVDGEEYTSTEGWAYRISDGSMIYVEALYEVKKQAAEAGDTNIVEVVDELLALVDDYEVGIFKATPPAVMHTVFISEAHGSDETRKGLDWRTRILSFGISDNRIEWTRPPVVDAVDAGLFDGVPCIMRSDEEHEADLKVSAVGGWFDNFDVTDDGLYGDLHLLESERDFGEKLTAAESAGKLSSLFGISIVADIVAAMKMTPSGVVRECREILFVKSADTVVHPSAGGAVLSAAASVGGIDKGVFIVNDKLKKLKDFRPDLLSGIDEANIDEAKVDALYDQMILEAGQKALEGSPLADPPPADPPADPPSDPPADPPAESDPVASEGKALLEEMKATEARIMKREQSVLIREKVTEAQGQNSWPPQVATGLISRLEGLNTGDASVLDTEIKAFKGMIASVAEAAMPRGSHGHSVVEVGVEEGEKIIAGFEGFFTQKKVKLSDGTEIDGYASVREAYRAITGDMDVTGKLSNCRRMSISESLTTTDFDQIAAAVMHRSLVADYRVMDQNSAWRQVTSSVVPLSDTRTQNRIRYGGYSNLNTVAEGGAYPALTSPTDEQATYTPSKYGGTEDITLEMIKNDDVGAIRGIPKRLATAAYRTLNELVLDFLADNSIVFDSVDLAHANHGSNLGSSALAEAALVIAIKTMAKQTEKDNSKRLGIRASRLLVPIDLIDTAYALTTLAAGNSNNVPDWVQNQRLMPIQVDYWTDTNDWWVVADPASCPTIEVGFMDNQQDPELFTQSDPTQGSLFDADKLVYKIRHWYGATVLDYRGFYAGIVG